MTQTFDIRFARSAGLAALLEVPENAFRWKGGGLLRIDAHGISIGLKRGLIALLGGKRTQRIPTENLRAVYREGDALRLEFQDGKTARIVLPFWADDRDTAAKIVRLLPTRQTVEIEHVTPSAKPPADWRMLLSLGALLVAVIVGSWAVYQRTQSAATTAATTGDLVTPEAPGPAPVSKPSALQTDVSAQPASRKSAAQRVERPAFPLNASLSRAVSRPGDASATSRAPDSSVASVATASTATGAGVANTSGTSMRASTDDLAAYAPAVPGTNAARRQLDLFVAESNTLRDYYLEARYDLDGQRIDEIEKLWWKVTVRVSNSPDFEDPALKSLQELELAVSRAWRRAFAMRRDPALLASGDAEVEFAEMLQTRAPQLVD